MTVEVTTDSAGGIVLECVEENGRLRMRVVTAGHRKGIREAGARFLVAEVREAGRGGFYRTRGEIRRLV
jgi:hypothetical protein